VLTSEELEFRREVIAGAPELAALQQRLLARARAVVGRRPGVPALKGMLTADGGVCPNDGAALRFDPWSPARHRCPRCGQAFEGDRHNSRWAWLQHLWLGERIAESSVAGLLAGDEALLTWAAETLGSYAGRYPSFPNADNVLGPARLFSSTYLESIWLTNYLVGAFLLREGGFLDEAAITAVSGVAEEAASLIGEFDEGLSNRQTWHNAALAATAVWFEDEELAQRAMAGPRGLVGHLVDGFRSDGMWFEGENYHLFALRGLLVGAGWARLAGVDLFEEEASQQRLAAALRAPMLSALPDGTFPARKDARFGVSLAQPMYLELWEQGIATLLSADQDDAATGLGDWLRRLYSMPAPEAEVFDSYLHEAGEEHRSVRGRADLSWWVLLTMTPELPGGGSAGVSASVLLPEQGLAILRDGERYLSLECGEYGGGHGHPDRLHLTLHAGRVHWLADPGTASYVSPDLFWYRSTLAHNAPRVDGVSQPMADARAEAFDVVGRWGWVRGRFEQLTRTVVAGPAHAVDVVEFASDHEHLVELPWHPDGELEMVTPGRWEAAALSDEFATGAERFVPGEAGPIVWRAGMGGRTLVGVFDSAGELFRLRGPDRPGRGGERSFLLRRQRGHYVRFATVLGFDTPAPGAVRFTPGETVVETPAATVVHRQSSDGWEVEDGGTRVALRGLRRQLLAVELPAVGQEIFKYTPPEAIAHHVAERPALDGTLTGFVPDDPLSLDHDDQYRRSETAFPGPEAFAACAWLAWDETALFVAVAVTKEDLTFRPVAAPPLRLDNEPDLIHSDGLQLYLQVEGQPRLGVLVVPDPDSSALQVHAVAGTSAAGVAVRGAWRRSADGYVVTLGISSPGWPPGANDPAPRFDLIVNEMRPGRARRLGQLVWTGGGGWVYLRGDRQDPARAGRLMLS
jgi:Heparinase II/III-like protein/Alginate lyase